MGEMFVDGLYELLRLMRSKNVLQAFDCSEPPCGDFGCMVVSLFFGQERTSLSSAAQSSFSVLQLPGQSYINAGVECAFKNAFIQPPSDTCSTYRRHFLCANGVSVLIAYMAQPWWDRPPILTDIERQIVDSLT